jgi:TolA-binding protein
MNTNSTIVTKPPTPPLMVNRNSAENNVEVDTLKRQLKSSEMTISELKTMVEKLTMENSMLKTRIDSQLIPEEDDVQL